MRRINVVGNSGSGKSTLAARIADRLGVPHIELDELMNQPDWRQTPPEEFRAEVERLTVAEDWVVDGNYSVSRDIVWGRADTVVWVDTPRALALWRLTARTVRRVITRETLWNGNRETPRGAFGPESILRVAWAGHQRKRVRYGAAISDPRWEHLRFVRLCTSAEADHLLTHLGPKSG